MGVYTLPYNKHRHKSPVPERNDDMSKHAKLVAPDISCNHCAMTIKRELSSVEGITSVSVDVPSKTVDLEYRDEESLNQAKEILSDIGYPVTEG
jgi:copper chaperone